jgi:cell wall-associated NlpC family hydrolase
MKQLVLLIFCCIYCHAISAHAAPYAVARSATPVLHTPAFSAVFGGVDGKSLKTDRCGQVRELEFIALPGSVFTIRAQKADGNNTVYRVETDEYPAPKDTALYVDSRFVEIRDNKPPPRARTLQSQAAIVASLKAAVGAPYVWGGNVQGGVGNLLELFYGGSVPAQLKSNLKLAGLDCSGLLYQATGGWTPRNTSQLLSFGKALPVAWKSMEEIVRSLEPLDLIVWNGHVVIVLDRNTTIESRLKCGKPGNGGVVTSSLQKRLTEILRTRRPVDVWPTAGKLRDVFVVRRWVSP